jgi:anti-sigma B factor antagonist
MDPGGFPRVLKIRERKLNDVAIIDCSGEVDLYSSTQLREALVKELNSEVSSVLINMTGISYIDSSGIATLLEGLQLSRKTQKRFGLYGLQKNARSVLHLARLDTIFTIWESEQEAVEKVPSTQPWAGL